MAGPLLLVTGATQGIGQAIASRFLAMGWRVAGTASSAKSLEALKTSEPRLLAYQSDLTNKAEVKYLAHRIQHDHGTPDVLVNNAGRFLPGAVTEEPDDHFEQLMALNLAAPYYLTKALAPAMKKRGSGTIINICSTASRKAYPNGGSYGISKHALLGLTLNLREELKPCGIRVTAVLPGPTLTASWAGTDLPPDRFLSPADVAEAVWLAATLPATSVLEEIVLRPQLGDI